jgi:DNA-binding beta-propeller fold protein YncE
MTQPRAPFALFHESKHSARLEFLAAVCAVVEGAAVPVHGPLDGSNAAAAVLNDAQRRVCALGGRAGMPRSLGSVYAGSIVRFLGGCRGVLSRVFKTGAPSWNNSMALSRDGAVLLVADVYNCIDRPAITAIRVSDGAVLQRVGRWGSGPLQFDKPRQVCVAPDGVVFVAELENKRIQVLTPALEFHSFVGVGQLRRPIGVCANDDTVCVSDYLDHGVLVFARCDGALLRRFGSFGMGVGQLNKPLSVCFVGNTGNIAVADCSNRRVCVFTVDGAFVRHLGVGQLRYPMGIACPDAGHEIVVADKDTQSIVVFDVGGERLRTLHWHSLITGVSLYHDTILTHSADGTCAVFT